MNTLEQAAESLAIRPMLWDILTVPEARVLRGRIAGYAYTAIGETIGGAPMGRSLVMRIEVNAIRKVLRKELKLVKLERTGYGAVWCQVRAWRNDYEYRVMIAFLTKSETPQK